MQLNRLDAEGLVAYTRLSQRSKLIVQLSAGLPGALRRKQYGFMVVVPLRLQSGDGARESSGRYLDCL